MNSKGNWLVAALFVSGLGAVTITDIQGPAFRSPLVGQNVHDVPGVVTAKVRCSALLLRLCEQFP